MCIRKHLAAVLVFAAIPLWSQVESGAAPALTEDRMVAPTPVSGEGYSLGFVSETPRTNYLRGELNFGSAYDDNILPSGGRRISDVSYSVSPTISLDQSRSRLQWDLTYSPGFTFYQRDSSLNQAEHNFAVALEYRLTPHVTFSLNDSFQKTSNPLSLSVQSAAGSGYGVVQTPNNSIVPPVTDRISNFGNLELIYQFSQNAMLGAKGTLSGLWYPNRENFTGLFDSSAQAGEGFYAHRLSGKHYIGATYQFQRLFAHPSTVETQTHGALLFYTLYLQPALSLSFYAGPQYSDTQGGTALPFRMWTPAAGASVGWQSVHTNFTASYSRRVSEGGGLSGAVRSNSADASLRWQLTKTLTAAVGANYAINNTLNALSSDFGGHTVGGTVSLQRALGEHFGVEVEYTHLRQTYSSISAISSAPDRNRVGASISYQFQRPLGR
jgi:hypothetical protein